MGDSQHSQVEFDSSQAKTSNSEKLPLPTGEGWGEGATFNSVTVEQLQKPNNETSPMASIAGAQVCAPYSDYILRGRIDKQKKAAFTLAEVLITLGIIGIVAALTLPSLIENVQEKNTVSKLKKSYSVLGQAVQMLINEKGELSAYSDITGKSDEEMVPMLTEIGDTMGKYFNQSRKCGINSGCGADKFYAMDGKTHLNDWTLTSDKRYNIDTVEGVQYNITWIARENICFQVYVDVNGKNLPNNIGKDIFPFYVYCNGKVVPRGMEANPKENIWENEQGWNSTAWVIYKENMDYLKCREKLSWSGQTRCKQ